MTSAVLISLLNALTLSPALCAILMRPEREHKRRFFHAFDRGFGRVMQRYDGAVRWLLPRQSVVLGAFVALGLATALLFWLVPTGFLPDEDQGYFMISFQLPDGASLERTEKVAEPGRGDPARHVGRRRLESLRRLRRAHRTPLLPTSHRSSSRSRRGRSAEVETSRSSRSWPRSGRASPRSRRRWSAS